MEVRVPETILGLPAHPLLVHGAVVLVPLATLALAVTGWRTGWRRSYALPVALIAVAGAFFAILAAQSGEPVEHDVRVAAREKGINPRFGDHPEEGENAEVLSIVFAVAAVAYAGVALFDERMKLPSWSGQAAYAVALIPAVLALVMILVAGHSGAELVWKDVGSFAAGA
jgi:hypothetical protein